MRDAKKVVEWLCCDCNRITLNGIAERCGYKNPHKMKRSKLEQIAYINRMLLGSSERYQIIDTVTHTALSGRRSRKSVIDYVLRECQFNWYDEDTVPVKKDTGNALRIVPVN